MRTEQSRAGKALVSMAILGVIHTAGTQTGRTQTKEPNLSNTPHQQTDVELVKQGTSPNKFNLESATRILNRNGHTATAGVILYNSQTGSLRASAAADYLVKYHRFTLTF